ncbi:hypothetical protein IW261DRAFT_991101 [Armillaria novae-zelandiae]|uniref:Fido domain-containing protein n=1 Tax=Armillaria novae-zelandiae TaxID=153914 RepID=A0AA39PGQ9_9AGAR|nr:hypothetical protein IW261DRAFT_991101 [Armillaria novae-zelandiae]
MSSIRLLTPAYATILNTHLVCQSVIVKPNELRSALVRPLQIARYGPCRSEKYLAASLAYGTVKNHSFMDESKRTGFLLGHMYLRAQELPGLVTQGRNQDCRFLRWCGRWKC